MLLAYCFPAKQGHTTNHLSSTAAIERCQNVGAVRAAINPRKRSVYRNSSRKKQSLSCITQLLRRLRRNPSADTILSRHGCVSCCGHLNIKPATCPVLDTSLLLLMRGGKFVIMDSGGRRGSIKSFCLHFPVLLQLLLNNKFFTAGVCCVHDIIS